MPSWIIVTVYALAVARVVRLLTADKITEPARDRLALKLWDRETGDRMTSVLAHEDPAADKPMLVYLVGCPWCVSIYVGAVAAPLVYWWGESPWLLVPALALAFSYATGFLAERGE